MSLSFEESLKNNNEEYPITDEDIILENENIEPTSIMAYSMRSMPMLLMDNDGWEKPDNYANYDYLNGQYKDEDFSTVDNNKNIQLSANQVNITQEKNSQYIPFKIPRRYDGFDLADTTLSIYYVNKNKQWGKDTPVDVYCNEDSIKFAWLVGERATSVSGILQFEIHAVGKNRLGNDYVWKTKSIATLNIIQSLEEIADGQIGLTQADAEDLYNKISKIESNVSLYLNETKDALNQAQILVDELNNGIRDTVEDVLDDKIGDVVNESIADELLNYYTKSETYDSDTIDQMIEGVKPEGYATEEYVKNRLGNLTNLNGAEITVKSYVDQEVNNVDISGKLGEFGTDDDGTTIDTVVGYVDYKVGKVDVSDQLESYVNIEHLNDIIGDLGYSDDGEQTTKTVKEYVDESIAKSDISEKLSNYATKEYADNTVKPFSEKIETNRVNIGAISNSIDEINENILRIEEETGTTYKATYGTIEDEDGNPHENMFTLWAVYNDDTESAISQFEIVGGGGIASTGSSPIIEKITASPCVYNKNDQALVYFSYSNKDSNGQDIDLDATIVYKVGTTSKNLEEVHRETGVFPSSDLYFDATKYLATGDQIVKIELTDANNSKTFQQWKVKKVDIGLEASLDGIDFYPTDSDVTLYYTANGDIEDKYIHIYLDKKPLCEPFKVSSSGRRNTYIIPGQNHGSHLLEIYMIANINGKEIPSEHYFFDIIWYEENNNTPIIGCSKQNISMNQYDTEEILFTVYDSENAHPTVIIYDGDILLDTKVISNGASGGYNYKAIDTFTEDESAKTHILRLVCGDDIRGYTTKEIEITVNKISINAKPVVDNIGFDFNPIGYSNDSDNKIWSYGSTKMIVPAGFDWINGGYKTDNNGDQYFCIKAGDTIDIDYKLFESDPKNTGKEFKIIFKTDNVKNRSAKFLSCLDNKIGLEMFVEKAVVSGSDCKLVSNYCENEIIEYEFNINKSDDSYLIMSYEDGTPSTPCEYSSNTQLHHTEKKNITIGSDDCDIHIYRMKAYRRSLTNKEVVSNFICDARNAEEMVSRDTRNRIYNKINKLISTSENGDFSAEDLMNTAPDLRYIFLEVPHFTNHKDDKIDNCKVYFRYPNGKRPEDNWVCTGVTHRGQGTSSNEYGDAGRNIDLVMDNDESLFEYTDEDGKVITSKTISLSDNSVPTDYLNIKVNIASSENANNAGMAKRFNEYQPFLRYARKRNGNIKDTMEFYNCVLFIRETSTDEANYPHREFNDTNWHFYAIGNVGDSKKTDDTRVNNKNDDKEFVVEIMDVDKPLSNFPTGKDGNAICSPDEWCSGNTAYDTLYAEYNYDTKGKFKSFGIETYEFRYESKNVNDQTIRERNINIWRDFYRFVVTSTDEEFYLHLKDYFVVESALYFYLFTERYTMVDNRAKNTFWHYGKVYISNAEAIELGEEESSYYIIDDAAAAINDGYRWDLTFGYDFDTCLGIDNTGNFVFQYGKEDTDTYSDDDPRYVFRAHDSTFFCRLRDLFSTELTEMYQDRDSVNAWSSKSLIKQWDESQSKFPEELWREDYERKYYRPYSGESIDNSIPRLKKEHLTGKFYGRKKYSRRGFEINQEVYIGSKYLGKIITDENIYFRGTSPSNAIIAPDYTLRITPYIDMYVVTRHSSSGQYIRSATPVKAGNEIVISDDAMARDFIYIYGAAYIQAIGDLSRCYIEDNDFSKAIRIQRLDIGSDDQRYDNPYMKSLGIGNNPLLEYINIRGVSGIDTPLDFSKCNNLKELYAERSGVTSVIFADGGLLRTAILPEIKSLDIKNLRNIDVNNFKIEKHKDIDDNGKIIDEYYMFSTLKIENTPLINSYELINNSKDYDKNTGIGLNTLRLTGFNWGLEYNIPDSDILRRMKNMGGFDSKGNFIEQSVVSGNIFVQSIKEHDLSVYRNTWPELNIIYDDSGFITQHEVKFMDGDGTVLETQYVDDRGNAIAPSKIPTKDSTLTSIFRFNKWDKILDNVTSDKIFYPEFIEEPRKYKIIYKSGKTEDGTLICDNIMQNEREDIYGSFISYEGETPVYTDKEFNGYFYLFNRWDKSGLMIEEKGCDKFYENDTKVIYAIFDEFRYTDGALDGRDNLDFSPVEIYAIKKLIEMRILHISNECIYRIDEFGDNIPIIELNDAYSFEFGRDFNYDDIESVQIVGKGSKFGKEDTIEFNGVSDYFDTNISLFDSEKDFVLAVDYEFNSNTSGSVLAQCYKEGTINNGFRLQYNSGVNVTFGSSKNVSNYDSREMIVLRYIASQKKMYIYASDLDELLNDNGFYLENSSIGVLDSTLVFGANKKTSTSYDRFAKGKIHWAKLWWGDLGSAVCEDLAIWPHEKIGLKVSGFERHYKQDGETLSSFSLLATDLLDKKMKINKDGSYNNKGGWKESYLNGYLNNKVYNSIPEQIKSLIEPVVIKSTSGETSTSTSYSFCYVTIPSLKDVDGGLNTSGVVNNDGYNDESGSYISTFNSSSDRKRGYDSDLSNNDNDYYWTRSPYLGYSRYYWRVKPDGSVTGMDYTSPYKYGVLIEISF